MHRERNDVPILWAPLAFVPDDPEDIEPDPDPAGRDAQVVPPEVAGSELVIDRRGRVHQAGADSVEGRFVTGFRQRAERSLYAFTKGVLGRMYLSPSLHRPICRWLQRRPPQRKLALLPREHAKTSIVSHALPLHILIQPAEGNLYFPGVAGTEQRIILGCETEGRAKDHLRVNADALEANSVLRSLWPAACWDQPRRQAKKWNDRELIVPRATEYPDPSIRAIGVDGAITGAHPTVLLKDDLISLEAANSEAVMKTAIDWHTASRALINAPECLEFIIGTRWAVYDLYQHIIDTDSTVAVIKRSVIEDGRPIYPERFALTPTPGRTAVSELRTSFGTLFPLLYMNEAGDPDLVDFDAARLRRCVVEGGFLIFDEDERDLVLIGRAEAPAPSRGPERGTRVRVIDVDELAGRDFYLRVKYA